MKLNGFQIAAIAAVPMLLAVGATGWLAFGEQIHHDIRAGHAESHHYQVWAPLPPPKAPVTVVIKNPRGALLQITHAELDGDSVWLRYENHGTAKDSYIRLDIKQKAKDGTIVTSSGGYPSVESRNSAPDALNGGEAAEAQYKVDVDPRTYTIEVSPTVGYTDD